jgi:hypothetical protein
MKFPTRINGIPCQCHVTRYTPYIEATWDSPAEDSEFEYEILDTKGYQAKWLGKYVTQAVEDRLFEEHHILLQAQEYEMAEY